VKKSEVVLIFTGDGKGKTTAAIGNAVRMLGWKKRVVYCTFFKNPISGEIAIFRKMKHCNLFMFCCTHPAFLQKPINKKEFKEFFETEWTRFLKKITKIKHCDLLVMDEILIAIRDNLLEEKKLVSFIKKIQKQIPAINIILTGRGMTKAISNIANVITEMKCIKHPYPAIKPTKGLEY